MKLVPLLITLMWLGMLWSRAILSMAMIALFAFAIIFYFRQGWKIILNSIWLQGMVLLFIIPLITAFWSLDSSQWIRSVQVKLPLLLMPFTIPVLRTIDKKTRQVLLSVLCAFVFVSSFYSYWYYFSSPGISDSYLSAKVLPVAMSNDHVRYAWLLVIVYAWMLYELICGDLSRRNKTLVYGFLAYLVIFIHVLAAKTGLLGFYLVTVVAIFSTVPRRMKLVSMLALVLIPLLSWFLLPSFQNRLKFVLWDFQNYSKGDYVEGLSDGPRILSYKAGWNIIEKNPLTGVGTGDVLKETWQWYDEYAPFLKDYERLLPSNEVMMYGCAGGILSAAICLAAFMAPFWNKRLRVNMLWISLHLVSFIGFMYEIGLEVQHGVFLYCFFSCWAYSRLSPDSATEAA